MNFRSSRTRLVRIALALALALATPIPLLAASDIRLAIANINNPYYPDRAPGQSAEGEESIVPAPPPSVFWGLEGDTVSIPITVISPQATGASIKVELAQNGKKLVSNASQLFRALDVWVEGNSNGNCTCPSGQLLQPGGRIGMHCELPRFDSLKEGTLKGCPDPAQRAQIQKTLIRTAPFAIKDPLEQLPSNSIELKAEKTELLLVDIPISPDIPKGRFDVKITVTPSVGVAKNVTASLHVLKSRLENFPAVALSYWLSVDPRDLIARPPTVALGEAWGGEWWGEQHWDNLRRAVELQVHLGTTNALVPLFARNPFGINAHPLVKVRCITGTNSIPTDFTSVDGGGMLQSSFNAAVASWTYDFDFDDFRRFIGLYKKAGIRTFEGEPLAGKDGATPQHLECDLYKTANDSAPYARNFRFLPRVGKPDELPSQQRLRNNLYFDSFLPQFLPRLAAELDQVQLTGHWLQHVIDESNPSDAALVAYQKLTRLVKEYLVDAKVIDAINQYNGPNYAGIVDIPVMHLALLYDDQMPRRNIRRETKAAFSGPKYFYNTALRQGGPNRFLDASPLEDRVYGWLAIELDYQGILYWAANQYRYPIGPDIAKFGREESWTPFTNSIGPLPGGYISPGYSPGANWLLYPGPHGLLGSLRARRLREGLLDHWLFLKATSICEKQRTPQCAKSLQELREQITASPLIIGDFSRNPVAYDQARETLFHLIEH